MNMNEKLFILMMFMVDFQDNVCDDYYCKISIKIHDYMLMIIMATIIMV